jgi:hypothetical protein
MLQKASRLVLLTKTPYFRRMVHPIMSDNSPISNLVDSEYPLSYRASTDGANLKTSFRLGAPQLRVDWFEVLNLEVIASEV